MRVLLNSSLLISLRLSNKTGFLGLPFPVTCDDELAAETVAGAQAVALGTEVTLLLLLLPIGTAEDFGLKIARTPLLLLSRADFLGLVSFCFSGAAGVEAASLSTLLTCALGSGPGALGGERASVDSLLVSLDGEADGGDIEEALLPP